MCAKFSSLVKAAALTLGLVGSVFADEPNFSVSGFAYNTSFSNSSFQNSRSIVAVNLDADYAGFAARAQVGSYEDPVRRAVLEYATNIGPSSDVVYQVGRFARVDSFFNGVVDNPASSQMDVLPFAGYSYRMFNGAFVLMDGQQVTASTRIEDARFSVRGAIGHMVIPSQKDIQMEALKRYDDQISMANKSPSYDIGFHAETRDWHGYVARNYYTLGLETTASDRMHKYIVSRYNVFDYTLDRGGLRYDNKRWFVSYEQDHGETTAKNMDGVEVGRLTASSYNVVSGVYVGDSVFYGGYSEGQNHTAGTTYSDSFIGATHNYRRLTFSLAYHVGQGKGWVKYGSDIDHWNTFVASATYRF